jgi:hypothetical protein
MLCALTVRKLTPGTFARVAGERRCRRGRRTGLRRSSHLATGGDIHASRGLPRGNYRCGSGLNGVLGVDEHHRVAGEVLHLCREDRNPPVDQWRTYVRRVALVILRSITLSMCNSPTNSQIFDRLYENPVAEGLAGWSMISTQRARLFLSRLPHAGIRAGGSPSPQGEGLSVPRRVATPAPTATWRRSVTEAAFEPACERERVKLRHGPLVVSSRRGRQTGSRASGYWTFSDRRRAWLSAARAAASPGTP